MAHGSTSTVHYVVVWGALIALTLLSLSLSLAHLGTVDTVVSLVIAAAKTCLVLLFFMHLLGERFSIVFVPFLVLFFVGLLVSLVVVDVVTRHTFPRTPAVDADDPPALSD
jgi:cytochrome c oxidase subunit 4